MLLHRAPEHTFLTHSTAALVWGAPLPLRLESSSRIHLGTYAGAAPLVSRHVIGHRLDVAPSDVTTWGGLRVTSPARTWFDLASVLRLDDLVAVGDYLIHHKAPLTDRVEFAKVIGRSVGKRGVRLARQALELLSDRAESRPESRLRVLLVTSGLPTPDINHPLVDTQTGRQVRPDFTFPSHRLILEYQGDYHRTRTQWRRDMTRRARLESQGWTVMELNADDLNDPRELVTRIQRSLSR